MPGGAAAAAVYAESVQAVTTVADSPEQLVAELLADPSPALVSLGADAVEADVARIVTAAHTGERRIGFLDGWRGPHAAAAHAKALAGWTSTSRPGVTAWLDETTIAELTGQYDTLTLADTSAGLDSLLESDGQRVLCLTTHGNGIDAPVSQAFLCGLLDQPEGHPLRSYFPCGYGAPCIREGLGPDGTVVRVPRVSTHRLPGDVVVWGTCSGVLTADAPFDPNGGLLQGLIRTDRLRQVLSTYKSWLLDEAAVLAAGLLVEAGHPLGDAVRLLNAAALAKADHATPPPWILLGDPTATLTPHAFAVSDEPADIGRSKSGLIRVDSTERDRLLLIRGPEPADESARSWLTPVGGNPLALWLRDRPSDGDTRLDVRSSDDSAEIRTLQRVWSAAPSLEFTHRYLEDAATASAGPGFEYPQELRSRVLDTAARTRSLVPLLALDSAFSGSATDLEELAAAEATAWHDLNLALHSRFVDHLRVTDHRFSPVYLNRPGADRSSAGTGTCPYCAHDTVIRTRRPNGGEAARATEFCDGCGTISDAEAHHGRILVLGPDTVTAGHSAEYQVRVDGARDAHPQVLAAALMVRPVPWFREERPESVLVTSSPTGATVRWTAPAGSHPGIYYLNAATVTDGSIGMGHRPVTVLPG
ncbi:hypothetical protein [Kitasatospora sp. NPDC097643]|uniref:hypothetical protein n=1 Tax=Kitasatospora sp. NPDC097643 TaxID=3157230 RepID=UPI00332F6D8C